jgi:hypothetical protein
MLCKIIVIGFGVLYLLALGLLAVGTFGLFGQAPDPLAGVFVVPLGLPWNRLAMGAPEALLPWIGVIAPLVNLGILAALCRWFSSRN